MRPREVPLLVESAVFPLGWPGGANVSLLQATIRYPNPSVSGAHLEFRQRGLVHQSHGLWPSEK